MATLRRRRARLGTGQTPWKPTADLVTLRPCQRLLATDTSRVYPTSAPAAVSCGTSGKAATPLTTAACSVVNSADRPVRMGEIIWQRSGPQRAATATSPDRKANRRQLSLAKAGNAGIGFTPRLPQRLLFSRNDYEQHRPLRIYEFEGAGHLLVRREQFNHSTTSPAARRLGSTTQLVV